MKDFSAEAQLKGWAFSWNNSTGGAVLGVIKEMRVVMLQRRRSSALVLLLFLLSACTQAPAVPEDNATLHAAETAAVSMAQTQAALIAASPTPVTSSALPTISFSTTPINASDLPTALPVSYPTIIPSSTPLGPLTATPTAAVLPANFSPVLLGKKYSGDMFFTPLGGVQGGSWISVDQAAAQIRGASGYDVYTFAGGLHRVYGYAPEISMISRNYYLSTDAALNETGMIGVAPGWRVTHRTAQELPSENELYRQVVTDWLSQAGIADPQTGTMHIYRVDLEGDGTYEIFISDTRVESQHTVASGDHSIVLMRKVTGNGAITIPILVDLYAAVGYGNPFPCSYSIANFIDLNQDGVLEAIIEFDRWEAYGASVYQINGETVQQVLGKTCITP